ncbi:UDP-glucuronosyl/UDP-glucosyltransferase [Artemisia annua]|uniref:Glycosyltransferase n=1 Tax=Artemisia annua TaxID=35608 RepID=A0A2U1LIB8_ARTAN|nr:UDP-glucuronosyl/UDP-glucosyltransferase [Artemisia annua]
MANKVAELIFIPIPGVGHIMSTIGMAKVLVNRDQRLSITVLIISPPFTSLALATYIDSLAKNAIERIRFIELPHDESAPKLNPKAPFTSFREYVDSHSKYVRNIVADMINQPHFGHLVGFVVDILSSTMIDVANEFNVPTYVFFTSNAAFLGFKVYMETLCADQNQDYVIELSKAEGEILLPGFVKPVPTKVLPQVYQTEDGMDFLMYSIRKMREAKAILVNTFLELETHAIKSFSKTNFPPVYPVGPILNLDGVAGKSDDKDVITWLDDQPPSSVVFLCFGSIGCFEEVQVKEIAYGLERSGYRFVWSLRRPPLATQSFKVLPDDFADPGAVLPDGFLERTKGIGKVIGWAPQVAMLDHPAVGGFVSHCGWNSMLESLWFGVPVATWPIYTDQQMNAFEMVVELGLAVEIKMDYQNNVFNPEGDMVIITAEEIERGIRHLMVDDEVRTKVKEMSRLSRASVTKGGSSYASVGCLVQDFTSNIT